MGATRRTLGGVIGGHGHGRTRALQGRLGKRHDAQRAREARPLRHEALIFVVVSMCFARPSFVFYGISSGAHVASLFIYASVMAGNHRLWSCSDGMCSQTLLQCQKYSTT